MAMSGADQPVAQLDQVRDEGRFGAFQLVVGLRFFGGWSAAHRPCLRPAA
jgi:hypothetical protein